MSVKKKSKLIWCLVLFLAVFVGGISTIVYSSSSTDITISLGDNKWSPNFTSPDDGKNTETLTDTWYVNTENDKSFTVDLSNYFSEKNTELKTTPFGIKATLNNVDSLELTEENVKSDDKGVFTITLPDKINGKDLGDNDNNIKLDIVFNGGWNIPKATKTFNVTVDKVAPEFEFDNINIKDNENPVDGMIKIKNEDKYRIKEAHMLIYEDESPKPKESSITFTEGSYNYKNDEPGKYKIIIVATDKAGNVSYNGKDSNEKNTIEFIIQSKEKATGELYKGVGNIGGKVPLRTDILEYINTKELTLHGKGGSAISEISYSINGSKYSNLLSDSEKSGRMKEVAENLSLNGTDDGKYTINTLVMDTQGGRIEKSYNIFVDTQNPEATVTGLDGNIIDGVTYIDTKKLDPTTKELDSAIDISDENLENCTVTLYKDNNKISTAYRNNSKAIENNSKADASLELNNEDEKSSSFGLQVNSDGNYSLKIEATDKAGNTNSENKEIKFVKDTQTPKVTVSDIKPVYSNTSEGEGYPEPVIDISDENYGTSIIKIKRNENGNDNEVASATIDEFGNFNKVEKEDISVEKDEKDNKFKFRGIKQDGKYTIDIYTKDKAGNEPEDGFDKVKDDENIKAYTKKREVNFIIDKTDPSITIKSGDSDIPEDEDIYYKEAQNINITASDDNLDPTGSKVSVIKDGKPFDKVPVFNSVDKEAKTSYKFDEDGKYELTVTSKDATGNSSTKTVEFVIDNIKPKITFGKLLGYSNIKSDIEFTVEEANYKPEGIKAECTKIIHHEGSKDTSISKISLDFSKEETKDGIDTFKIDKDEFDDDNATYEIKLNMTDLAGREAKEQKATFIIDKSAPEIEITGVDADSHYNTDKTVNITTTDDNQGTNTIKATKNGEEFKINDFKLEGNKASTFYDFKEEGAYEITVDSVDKAGNNQCENITFVVDKTTPVTKISSPTDKIINSDKSVTIDVADDYIDTAEVAISCTKKTPDGESNPSYDFIIDESNIKEDENHKKYASNTYNFSEEGDYTLIVNSKDSAGNIQKEPETIEFTVDKSAPEIEITGVDVDNHYNTDKVVDIKTTDDNQGTNTIKATKNGEEFKINDFKVEGNKASTSYDFKEEGTYEIAVDSVDKAGNDQSKNIAFVVDKTAPVTKISSSTEKFINSDKSVTIDVADDYIDTAKVAISCTKKTPDGESNPSYDFIIDESTIKEDENHKKYASNTYNFSEEGDYTLIVNSKDSAGNIQEPEKIEFTVDKTVPEVNFTGITDGSHYNDSVKSVGINVKDENLNPELGNNIVTVFKDGEEYKKDDLDCKEKEANKSYDFTEEGTYVLKVKSVDKAGNIAQSNNEGTYDITFVIDRTAPAIDIKDFDSLNNSFNNNGRDVTVSVAERYYDTNSVTVSYEKLTPDGNSETINPGFGANGIGEVTTQNYSEFNDDAQYSMTISAKDKAGNESSRRVVFTTDKTNPSVSITGVDFDQYYNVDKTVALKSTDVNQRDNVVAVTKNGQGYNIGGFGLSGRDADLSYTFSEEGTYEINYTATDKAGNPSSASTKFTIDKTAPRITPMESVDGTEIHDGAYINKAFTPVFKLDNQEDTIETVSLNDGGNIAGDVPMASEETKYNYKVLAKDKASNETTLNVGFTVDTITPQIKISGIMSGFFNKDMEPQYEIVDTNLDASRTSALLNGAPFTSGTQLDQQENYNFKLVATDLANNESNNTISFTIDKDKPVIKFETPMSGKYFTEDFVPNFIIDDLTDYTIISMTLDGEDYEMGDTITTEGKHVLYIEVQDKAGNTESVSVEFILDKTPPKFVVDGVKDGETYYEATSASVKLDNPQDKINSVTVNGQLIENHEKDEFGQDVYKLDFNDIKNYEVVLKATDEAGNKTEDKLNFKIADKTIITSIYTNKFILYPLVGCSVGAVAAVGTVLFRRRLKLKVK